ncbi:MAG: hypothetical protein IKF79_04775 [Methanosphaera sp.]|nr:hypothetical protein [Methanosphaera sp.]
MIKITLNQVDARPNGRFFLNITEACNRGCPLTWAEDYSKAILELDTTAFLTKQDIKNIIESGGEIEGLVSYVVMNKSTYETGLVPEDIMEYAFPDSEEKVETIWKALFNIAELQESGDYKVALSPCSVMEPVPMSLVLNHFEDFEY